ASAAPRPGAGQSGSSRSGADQAGTGPSATPSAARPISALGYPGRFAIYDPGLLDSAELSTLGPPDVNALDSTPSVQGYSSIVNGSYASATGSHSVDGGGQNVLSPAAIGNGTLDSLNTSVLLTLPSYLTTTAEPGGSAAGSSAAGRRTIQAGQNATWYLGESVTVSRVSVPDRDARTDAARGTEIGLMAPGGATSWYPARAASATSLEISLPRPMAATTVLARAGDAGSAGVSRLTDVSWPTGIARSSRASGSSRPTGTSGPAGTSGRADTPTVLTAGSGPEGDTGRVLGAASVTLAGGRVLVANGALQNDLTAPRWDMAGFDGQFAVFTDRFASGPLTVQPRPAASGSAASGSPGSAALSGSSSSGSSSSGAVSGSAGGGSSGSGAGLASVRYTTSAAGSVTAATVSSAHGVRLVRSMAAIPGWTALWQPRHGRPVTLNVQRDGIVQAIDVPPGQGTVTWRYTTPRLELGLAVSAAAALCTAALAIGRGPRRRRAESVAPGPERERGFSRSAV
ncbi:MAG: hypothetical protein J2P26_08600, partial [Nocardiopsaceae bacterium]|nr:hypothetical protein [Nocardiopsaceae bacterium]